jgi:microcystin-dependent protein
MEEGTIGEIRLFAGFYEPKGWVFCNGQTLSIQYNQALYSILGTKYGGDGKTTFALPKISPVLGADSDTPYDDLNYVICVNGMYTMRS